MLRMSVGMLRATIRSALSESTSDEQYNSYLIDDPAFDEKSIYVPDDVKSKIRSWAKEMGLARS